jgi:hypothetical protein
MEHGPEHDERDAVEEQAEDLELDSDGAEDVVGGSSGGSSVPLGPAVRGG